MASKYVKSNFALLGAGREIHNDIDNDAKEINELLLAAKGGNWEKVWTILGRPDKPRKEYLINIIPEGRRWGILHQAIFWKVPSHLQKLLQYKACDLTMSTKNSTFMDGSVCTKTPTEIVAMYGTGEMAKLLQMNHSSLEDQELQTYFKYDDPKKHSKSYILLEVVLAAYKQAFHPTKILKGCSMLQIMRAIFTDFQTSVDRFEAIKAKVCESIKGEFDLFYTKLKESKTREEFCSGIIYSYTVESAYQLYSRINLAMRRQRAVNYRPTAKDFAIGPFILMYQTLLLYWDDIKQESGLTYRKMKMLDKDLMKYSPGLKFIWPSVTSSTVVLGNTHAFPTQGPSGDKTVIFTIDNSRRSAWQPRNIEKHACFTERERTYPAGAPFMITKGEMKDGTVHIYLTLLSE